MQRHFLSTNIACIALLASCSDGTHNASQLQTDLGDAGNTRVVKSYETYREARTQNKIGGCQWKRDNAKRVLITGFGPFSGGSVNLSGLVVDALSRTEFWNTHNDISALSLYQYRTGEFLSENHALGDPGEYGARAMQRTLWYNNTKYEVCLIVAAVQWDLAAAIYLYEMERFRPEFVLMTGLGGLPRTGNLEAVAVNQASSINGYESNGNPSKTANLPIANGTPVLPAAPGVQKIIQMNWSNKNIATKMRNPITQLNAYLNLTSDNAYSIKAASGPSPGNDYICNNVSFVVAHALNGTPLSLAGGSLKLKPRLSKDAQMGFFHYPYKVETTERDLLAWGHVVFSITEAAFSKNFWR